MSFVIGQSTHGNYFGFGFVTIKNRSKSGQKAVPLLMH